MPPAFRIGEVGVSPTPFDPVIFTMPVSLFPRMCRSLASAFLYCMLLGMVLGRADGAEPDRLDPLEVRAQRSMHSPMGTDEAVTAFSGEYLNDQRIRHYEDVARLVPGIFISPQAVDFVSLNVRGLTSDTTEPNVPPRVSVFQDGVAISEVHGSSVAMFDLENLAVLKGPRSTEFGRAVQSGAISLTSRRAADEASGELAIGAGEFGARTAEGFFNAPLVAGKLFARAAFSAERREGFVDNLADASDLQGRETAAVRVSVRWQPNFATTADFILSHQHDTPPGTAFKSAVFAPPVPGGDTNAFTPAFLNRGAELGTHRTITGTTAIVRHEMSDAWTLNATSAWREVKTRSEFDADGSFLFLLEPGEAFEGRSLSQELRADFDGGTQLTMTIGGNVAHERGAQEVRLRTDEAVLFTFLSGLPSSLLPAPNPRYEESYRLEAATTSFDVFGRADYRVTSALSVGVGLRGTNEQITTRYASRAGSTPGQVMLLPASGSGNNFFRPTPGTLTNDADNTSWSGEIDARYTLAENMLGYASIARGRRAPVAGINQATLSPYRLGEESVVNFEAGLEGEFPLARLRYDVSAFHYEFAHFQTQRVVAPGVTLPVDSGRARGRGAEISLRHDVGQTLSLFGSYGYTSAKFLATDDAGFPQALAGNTFRLTSRHTAAIGGEAARRVSVHGTVKARAFLSYRSAHFFEDDNALVGGTLRQGGFSLLNASLSYASQRGDWEFVAHAENLSGKEYLVDAGNLGAAFGAPTFVPGAPRMWGATVIVRF